MTSGYLTESLLHDSLVIVATYLHFVAAFEGKWLQW